MDSTGRATGALDSTTGRAVLRVLQNVNEELGATVLIITHAAATAAMTDRVIHFSDGHIREVTANETKQPAEEIAWGTTAPGIRATGSGD